MFVSIGNTCSLCWIYFLDFQKLLEDGEKQYEAEQAELEAKEEKRRRWEERQFELARASVEKQQEKNLRIQEHLAKCR